ncbi:MAG TPA: multiprotein bridging factor aMBF1 [Methanoregulaceae archaeon]|jgi:putative transcription factor|nr:TIGR00270 family protein [Methanolinea sp.]MDD3090443.1 multiprotein bridging factor aMBF1 [Methanoregulaceae archaeon]MDD5048422.1 multiprotein bridging factor aMBF1 [Methanoregulaceae archaeon]MDD5684530.1 multiprotein bridging factor aMBF1 [Methanoregulaceae archaeon]HOP67800.1 multiprotein bridging factor aMBF1 [Methanoregulaceae archaeon]
MQCELCGSTIHGPSRTVRIEGAELEVCAQCAKYGTEVQKPRKAAPGRAVSAPSTRAPARKRRDVFDFMEGEIVENYGAKIRDARMERGWSQKDLAMEMKEKELLIKKIEKEDLIPEDDVRIKIEKTLGIRLIDTAEEEEETRRKSKMVPTMGDVISIKKIQK